MLERLGIYGMQGVERAILTGLVTGEPVLLIGAHGTAKTALCRKLAGALGASFIAYDAGKALFEDILGFPDPTCLQGGKIEYIPTPISIWGKQFVLIDELSRAAISMQNKWMEVIRSRQIMGKRLPELRYVFAAMNPPSYLGATPLDEALAGRFSLIVQVPDVSSMGPEDIVKIVMNVTEDDMPGSAAAREHEDTSFLPEMLAGARARLEGWESGAERALADYVSEVASKFTEHEIKLDGRRMGMMFRTLKAYLSLRWTEEGSGLLPLEDCRAEMLECLPFTLPPAASGQQVSAAAVRAAHEAAFGAAVLADKPRHIRLPDDPTEAARLLLGEGSGFTREGRRAAVNRLLGTVRKADTPERALCLHEMAAEVCRGGTAIEAQEQFRVIETYCAMTIIPPDSKQRFLDTLDYATGEGERFDPASMEDITAWRIVFARQDGPGRRDLKPFMKGVEELLDAIAEKRGASGKEVDR